MKNIIVATLVSVLFVTQVFANCNRPATNLVKGAKAPCTGTLFSPEKEKELRVNNEKYKITLQQLGIQNKILEIYKKDNNTVLQVVAKEQQKSELWRKAAEESTEKLIKSESGRDKRDWIFFILGILTTGVAAYGLNKIER